MYAPPHSGELVLVRGVRSLAVDRVLPGRSRPWAAWVGHVQIGVGVEVGDPPPILPPRNSAA